MGQVFRRIVMLTIAILVVFKNNYALIGPIRVLPSGNVLLVPCDEIKLSEEHIDLYHHRLGIWLVEYRVLLKNLGSQEIIRPVGFPAGLDIRTIESNLYCDRFENFTVSINDQPVARISYLVKCSNYVAATGTKWSTDDVSGIGFLNTWELKFKPEEQQWIKVTFSFIVKKAPPIYNPDVKDSWYNDLANWLKLDYAMRAENSFQLPLNIGSFWAFYPDSIMIRTYEAQQWLKIINKSEQIYQPEFIKKYEFGEPVGFYSPPEVAFDTLTVDQIQAMSPTELMLLRNSFLAKYGKRFENATIRKYFKAQPWYRENPDYHNWYLTQWDLNNIKLITEFEARSKQNKATNKLNH